MSLLFSPTQGFELPARFKTVINKCVASSAQLSEATQAITLNFRDPNYSAEQGGYHPLEVRLEKRASGWKFIYITDFCYLDFYQPELVKEVDICFASKTVRVMDRAINDFFAGQYIRDFIRNFLSYHQLGVFEVEVSCEN
ncbi:hypothetical protein DS2_14689 [Catenovulum agarivorans DS-2]|uniref:DUF2787 domain-containing protein n=1 Tax=Catenovulum agarivorans DS-2 TaxID=1328313 RepID=W7QU97_9ALTE|nr:DUF2787 family protein [Catenovulum agarivorans]EWH09030.1 hypothetical protein DS2_14689 [Catenovulum agarivorans DS-2]